MTSHNITRRLKGKKTGVHMVRIEEREVNKYQMTSESKYQTPDALPTPIIPNIKMKHAHVLSLSVWTTGKLLPNRHTHPLPSLQQITIQPLINPHQILHSYPPLIRNSP